MNPQRTPTRYLPNYIKNEHEGKLERRCQLATEKFKSDTNLQEKRSEKYQERFLKIDAEIITYLTGHFEKLKFVMHSSENGRLIAPLNKKINKNFQKKGRPFSQ